MLTFVNIMLLYDTKNYKTMLYLIMLDSYKGSSKMTSSTVKKDFFTEAILYSVGMIDRGVTTCPKFKDPQGYKTYMVASVSGLTVLYTPSKDSLQLLKDFNTKIDPASHDIITQGTILDEVILFNHDSRDTEMIKLISNKLSKV